VLKRVVEFEKFSVCWEADQVKAKGLVADICIPSRRHPNLVPDFARQLASRLGIPSHAVLVKTDDRPEQKTMANSTQQARNDGRTGLIINILFLVQKGLLDLPVLYLSKYIIEHKNYYYRLLRQVTEKGLWEPWILFMLKAVKDTAVFTRERTLAIRALMNETMEAAKEKLPAHVYSKELIETIYRQPYTKGQFLVDAGIAQRKTAAEYLKELEKIGILKAMKIGKETLYLNTGLYELLSH